MFSTKPKKHPLEQRGSRRVHITRNCKTVMVILGLALVTGCASTKQYAPITSGSGTAPSDPNLVRIYVMRPGKFVGAAASFEVQEGSRTIGKIGPGGHLCWERPPGEVRIVDPKLSYQPLRFKAEKGRTYYVEWQIHALAFAQSEFLNFRLLTEEEGRKTLEKSSREPKPVSK